MIIRRTMVALILLGLCVGAPSRGALAPSPPITNVLQIPRGHFVTLCFHGVFGGAARSGNQDDPYAISATRLAQWFDWMHEHGWHPVSIQQIINANARGVPLPANAVLLSFDDGLETIYSVVYPLLKAYHYPALFALETGWLRRVHGGGKIHYTGEAIGPLPTGDERRAENSPNLRQSGMVFYNGQELGANGFVTWSQVREMQASGLAEFATHTDDLHHGILANPQGNLEPAAITRLYDKHTHTYETEGQYRQRIRDDLKRSINIITAHTGHRPRVIVWPYGAASRQAVQIAHALGLRMSFTLADNRISSPHQLGDLGRFLITRDGSMPTRIEAYIDRAIHPERRIQRAVQVDLDYIYDPDPAQVNRNLSKLLDRIKAMHVRTVYLQAFADPDGDGTASALYFPNHYLPMRADLFNRVAWQLITRAGVRVYAWLPLLAFDLPEKNMQNELDVKVPGINGKMVTSPHAYRRLSPFMPRSLQIVSGIYADLARDASGISGVLIGDDAYLASNEDASSCEAVARWPGTKRILRHCRLDSRRKTLALIDFGKAVVSRMRPYLNESNQFSVARNLYARVVMQPAAEKRFAQALGPFLNNYNEVALMAMPYLFGARESSQTWLSALVSRVARYPGAMNKVVFELQARDWRGKGHWIEATTLKHWMQLLIRHGAINLAYYPDDFVNDRPAFAPTFVGISLNQFPHWTGRN